MKNIRDFKVGQSAQIKHKISEEDIDKFVNLTGDNNRLHVDSEFAKNTELKKIVSHGMLGASFISTVIGTKLPGDGALWFSQTLEFLLPVHIGDEIKITAEILSINFKNRVLEIDTKIKNQNNKIVTKGIAKVKLLEKKI